MKYKIINTLGKGRYATTYNIIHNNIKRVLKIGTYKKENKNELAFYKFINTLPNEEQKYFSVLHDYKKELCRCINKCKYDRNIYQFPGIKTTKQWHIYHILDHKGSSLNLRHNYTENDKQNIINQIIHILKIIRSYGYVHGDIHTGNICISDMNVSIIDYDSVTHRNSNIAKYTINYDMIMLHNNILSQKGQMQGHNIINNGHLINIRNKIVQIIPDIVSNNPKCINFIINNIKNHPYHKYNIKWIEYAKKYKKIPKIYSDNQKFPYCIELFLMYFELFDKELFREKLGFLITYPYWINKSYIFDNIINKFTQN